MKIQHKRSAALDGSVAKEPTAAQTDLGELCVNFNTADPALFIRDNADNIRRVGGDLSLYQKIEDTPPPVFVCLPNEINSQSPPAERLEGTLWWNTEEGILYVWFEDGDSEQWVIAVPQTDVDVPPGTVIGETPPSDPEVGQLWWNSSDDSGRLYVYYEDVNSQQWVEASPQVDSLTEEQSDNRYLSKVSDDTAEGEITFKELTTHEAGVKVTGGTAVGVGTGFYSNGTNSLQLAINGVEQMRSFNGSSTQFRFGVGGSLDTTSSSIFNAQFLYNGTGHGNQSLTNIQSKVTSDTGITGSSNKVAAIAAAVDNQTGTGIDVIGVESAVETSNAPNGSAYNFYAAGSAPNYFAGDVNTNGNANVFETKGAPAYPVNTPAGNGIHLSKNGSINQLFTSGTATSSAQYVCRAGAGAGRFVQYRTSNGPNTAVTESGYIQITGLNTLSYNEGPSDYRLKQNIQPLTSATSKIKQLKPCSFEYTNDVGNEYHGFIAHEVQEVGIPHSWHGTKDATEAIGTLADYDGTELETDVVEPSAEELEYTEEVETDGVATMVTRTRTWTATGTRPVYQGVDQTKLIPLLTKALQEVMQKNEDLEARIAALEGA